jgi:hypothetical protein
MLQRKDGHLKRSSVVNTSFHHGGPRNSIIWPGSTGTQQSLARAGTVQKLSM